jgi:hypothetical protein
MQAAAANADELWLGKMRGTFRLVPEAHWITIRYHGLALRRALTLLKTSSSQQGIDIVFPRPMANKMLREEEA